MALLDQLDWIYIVAGDRPDRFVHAVRECTYLFGATGRTHLLLSKLSFVRVVNRRSYALAAVENNPPRGSRLSTVREELPTVEESPRMVKNWLAHRACAQDATARGHRFVLLLEDNFRYVGDSSAVKGAESMFTWARKEEERQR